MRLDINAFYFMAMFFEKTNFICRLNKKCFKNVKKKACSNFWLYLRFSFEDYSGHEQA